jgi:riboflavin kinase/FMN adenylyltransferase
MNVCHALERFVPPEAGVVLTIGNFDGIHRGHARLVATAQDVAARLGSGVAVLTFHPHPLATLAPERAPAVLTTPADKLVLLERLGVADCIVLRSTPELLRQHADDFLASLVAHCRPRAIVEGPDFNFGRGRSGDIDTLREHAAHWGYELHVVPAVRCDELPSSPTASSSSIRQALKDGRIDAVSAMLARPYRIVGRIGYGAGRGAHLGFPTANLEQIPQALPQHAVYAAVVQLESGALHPAAVNIGPQPTFADEHQRVEAFVLDFAGDLRAARMAVYFLRRLRGQVRFSGPDALHAQIERDVAETRAIAQDQLAAVRDNLLPI